MIKYDFRFILDMRYIKPVTDPAIHALRLKVKTSATAPDISDDAASKIIIFDPVVLNDTVR
jgi:hypothetical protein